MDGLEDNSSELTSARCAGLLRVPNNFTLTIDHPIDLRQYSHLDRLDQEYNQISRRNG